MFALKASSHLAANSSSTIRRSQDKVTVITLSIVSFAVSTGRVPPTAMIQACGGLITAENSVIPNIPRLEIVNEPPWNSCSFSLPSRARLARSCIEGEQIICHGLRISKNLGYIFQVHRLQSVLIPVADLRERPLPPPPLYFEKLTEGRKTCRRSKEKPLLPLSSITAS